MFLLAAVVAALAAALSYGVSAILEQRSVHQVAERGVFAPRLLVDLARRPLWLASIVATVIGAALQALALHFGPLALVQPILVLDLLFAVLIASGLRRAAPDRVIFAGVVFCTAGVAVFLAVSQPTGGTETVVSLSAVMPLAILLGVVLAICLSWAKFGPRTARPLVLGLACGVCNGVAAFLLKLVTFSLAQGFSEPLEQWPVYALAIVGPVGFLLNQEAFQSGTLIAPALAVITTVTSLVSIGIGYLWLNENVASGPWDVVTEVASLAAMTAGIAMLAYRAPAVTRERAAAAEAAHPQFAGSAALTSAGRPEPRQAQAGRQSGSRPR
jgi:drug/metabolite transporter (DMT)-like permease